MSANSRAVAVLVGIVVFLVVFLVFAQSAWPIALYRLETDGIITFAWILSAAGLGWPILALFRQKHLVTAIALGLGVMSLIVLALGLIGWLNHITAIALICVGLLIFTPIAWSNRESVQQWLAAKPGWGWMWIAAMLPAGMIAVAALIPPGILWGDEPNGYDVVEYHFQVPRQWYEAGRITPLHENVFSYFPQGVEMHYLLAMELRGGPWAGMYLAQFMHMATCALAAIAVGEGGLIVALTPWLALLAPIGYVEGGVLLYGALAMLWTLKACRVGNAHLSLVAGIMAGFACSAKLTNIPMLLIAIPLAMLTDRAAWLKKTSIFAIAGFIVLAPWLIRTAAWSGNPVFPQAMNSLGHDHFSPVQVQRWQRAYVPTTPRLRALGEQIIADPRYGFILLPAALLTGAIHRKSMHVRFLLAMLAILTLVWLGMTHLQSRFFVLAIPICALLIAHAKGRWWIPTVAGVLLIVDIAVIAPRLFHYLDLGAATIIGRENLAGLRGPDPTTLSPGTHLDLVGDACPFLYQTPMSHLSYRTVFDVDTSDPARSIVEDWIGRPITPLPNHLIVIDPAELARFSRTYFNIPRLTPEELRKLASRPDVYIITPAN